MIEKQCKNIFIEFHQFISLFNILDEFNIKFSKQWLHQNLDHCIRNFRSNSNHLSVSRIFQNSYQILSELIVFFYSLDQLDISSRNFRIFSQYLGHSWFLKIFKNYICLFSKLIWIFVIYDEVDSIRIWLQIIFEQFSTRIILKSSTFFENIAELRSIN